MQLVTLSLPYFVEKRFVTHTYFACIRRRILEVKCCGDVYFLRPGGRLEFAEVIGVQKTGFVTERKVVHAALRAAYRSLP